MADAIWRFFSSLKLAAANALGLAAAAAAGVILDRREIFQSWWFTLALLGMALSVIAFSVQRLPRVERGRYAGWLGSFSILVMLAGGIAGSFVDFEGTVVIPPGGGSDSMTVRSPGGDWKRRLGFILLLDGVRPGTSGLDLRIFERLPDGSAGRPLARRLIDPDRASEYAGFRLSQGGFEPSRGAEIRIARNPSLPVVVLGAVLLLVSGLALAARLLLFGER